MKIIYKENYYNGFARVRRKDGLWNFISTNGNILSPNLWFKDISFFYDGFARVRRQDGLYNFIGYKGNILSHDMWFVWTSIFYKGCVEIQREDNMWNIIGNKGNLLSPKIWFNDILYQEEYFILYHKSNRYFLDKATKSIHKLLI